MKLFLQIFFILFVVSCSHSKIKNFQGAPQKKQQVKNTFEFSDKNGTYLFERESGYEKKKKLFYTRQKIIDSTDVEKILEESEVHSVIGKLGKKLTVLRPTKSSYAVWFDKKKYSAALKLLPKERSFRLTLESPENQWNGTRKIKFPSGKGIFCFFSQIVECVNTTNFINIATEQNTGAMRVYVIWDGFPYMQEQYEGIPDELFTEATFEFDGKNERSERRFTLRFSNQSIFYFVDNDNNFYKMFWVAQGISVVRSDARREKSEIENDEE